MKLLRVTKACCSFTNKSGRVFVVFFKTVVGHCEKAVALVCCHFEKAEKSLS